MKHLILIVTGLLLSCMFFTNTSCKKNTDCVAEITCLDSLGNTAVPNASVQLYANVKTPTGGTVKGDLTASGVTTSDGKVKFTFKLPAIYDVSGSIKSGTRTLAGTGIIKLEEGKTIACSVNLK